MSSNIKETLTNITGKTYDEEDIYNQNEPTNITSYPSEYISSAGLCSLNIWRAREADPSQMIEEDKILKHYKKKDTPILSLFRAPKRPSKKQNSEPKNWWNNFYNHPKKEYLRCKLIRGHKNVNRHIQKNTFPKNFELNAESLIIWKKLKEIHESSKKFFYYLSATSNEPQQNGKSKSFSNEFCAGYFKEQVARESFYYYIEFLFSCFEPKILIKMFKFWCCPEVKGHNSLCSDKWYLLKRFINNLMIADLGLEPWFPEGNNEKQITDEELKEIMKINKNSEGNKHISERMFRDERVHFDDEDKFLEQFLK